MGHVFSHLTLNDRYRIEALLLEKRPIKEIAEIIHVHETTIYREIKRARYKKLNGDTWTFEDRYNPDEAHRKYKEKMSAKGPALKIGKDFELANYIEKKIRDEKRSPAAALADIKLEGKKFKTSICLKTLYSYISKGVFLTITNADLPEKTKRKRKYNQVREQKRASRGESIENRPKEIEDREEFGHWEMDTVYSSKKGEGALLVLSERATRREIIEKMPDRTAESTIHALNKIERRYGALFKKIFKTITVDNGSEFSNPEALEKSAIRKGNRTKFYYCHPYSSYERGTNECLNKMIRRIFPKGTDFSKVSAAAIKETENWMNNYPRKILNWKTANIVFDEFTRDL